MNLTVKAPLGAEYDVDIEKVKEKYFKWRRKHRWIAVGFLFCMLLWVVIFLADYSDKSFLQKGLLASFGHVLERLLFSWQGWVFCALAGVVWFYGEWIRKTTVHFECPFRECNTQIFLNYTWICPKCWSDNLNIPLHLHYKPHTFFDTCKHGHKLESYQCPKCVIEGRLGVFKLVPNGRTDKFVKPYFDPPIQQPVQQPPREELMPRDDRFF